MIAAIIKASDREVIQAVIKAFVRVHMSWSVKGPCWTASSGVACSERELLLQELQGEKSKKDRLFGMYPLYTSSWRLVLQLGFPNLSIGCLSRRLPCGSYFKHAFQEYYALENL